MASTSEPNPDDLLAQNPIDEPSGPSPLRGLMFVLRIVYVAVFGGLIVLSAFAAVVEVVVIRSSARAEATLTGIESRVDPDDDDEQVREFVRVSFQDGDGRPVEAERPWANFGPPVEGERVDILFDPDDPTEIRFDGFLDTWATVLGLVAVSVVLALLLGYQARRYRRGR